MIASRSVRNRSRSSPNITSYAIPDMLPSAGKGGKNIYSGAGRTVVLRLIIIAPLAVQPHLRLVEAVYRSHIQR
jgi:hypothetical protein